MNILKYWKVISEIEPRVRNDKNYMNSVTKVGLILAMFMATSCSRQFQDFRMEDRPLETKLPVQERHKTLAIGTQFSVGIKKDGTVWTWGSDSDGILAREVLRIDDGRMPGQVQGLPPALSVSAWDSVLVLARDGSVWSWGRNSSGQLGYATEEADGFQARPKPMQPRQVPGIPSMKAVEVAGYMGVALSEAGELWAWGGGGKNTLFSIDGGQQEYRPPSKIKGLPPIRKFSANNRVIAAIDEAGTLWTVGVGVDNGRQGSGDLEGKRLIGKVQLPGKVVDVDLNGSAQSAMALLENGQVWTWGWNHSGQLGLGHRDSVYSPQRIKSISRIKLIGAGLDYKVAISEEGDLLYWGNLIYGRSLEPSASTQRSIKSPVRISERVRATEVEAGSEVIAFLDKEGGAWFLGRNRSAERGTGMSSSEITLEYVLTPERSKWTRQ